MKDKFTYYFMFFSEATTFELVKSETSPENFGNKFALFSTGELLIRIVLDRSELSIDFANKLDSKQFFDFDLVGKLLSEKKGNNGDKKETEQMLNFVIENLNTVETLFSGKNLSSTVKRLNLIANQRFQTNL